MKCSVIIPNYNHARFLEQRIESVINQSYSDFEIILLDDKSNDESEQIIRRYENNEHVSHVVINSINSGSPFVQWEKGINLSAGELIWIAESDDYADKDFLMRSVQVFKSNPLVALVVSQSNVVDENGILLHKHSNGINKDECWNGKMFIRSKMMRNNFIVNASSVIFRKDAIPNNLYFTKFHFCGDWLFWCEVSSRGDISFIEGYYNNFRMHSNKVTPSSTVKGQKYAELVKFYPRIFHLAGVGLMRRYLYYFLLCFDMLRDGRISVGRAQVESELRSAVPLGCFALAKLAYFCKTVQK